MKLWGKFWINYVPFSPVIFISSSLKILNLCKYWCPNSDRSRMLQLHDVISPRFCIKEIVCRIKTFSLWQSPAILITGTNIWADSWNHKCIKSPLNLLGSVLQSIPVVFLSLFYKHWSFHLSIRALTIREFCKWLIFTS